MPKRSETRLTDTIIAVLKRDAKRTGRDIVKWCRDEPGFGVRIKPSGTATFCIQYRRGLRSRRFALRGFDHTQDARLEAEALLNRIKRERRFDPADEHRQERGKAAEEQADAFEAIAKVYLARAVRPKLRSAPEVERMLFGKQLDEKLSAEERREAFGGYVVPKWKGRRIHSLTLRDVTRLCEEISDAHGPAIAHRVFEVIRALFSWQQTRDETFRSPLVRGAARHMIGPKAPARDRALDDREIMALWPACDRAKPSVFGALVKALLLTGARRDELAGAKWNEIADNVLVVPAERVKKTRRDEEPKPFAIPLTKQVRQILAKLTRHADDAPIFTTDGKVPISGFSKAKRQLDDVMRAELANRKHDSEFKPFRIHDLRRTARTLLARAGVSGEHAERILGHAFGRIEGVYNTFQYLDEKRAGLEALAALVDRIVAGKAGDVIEFGVKKRRSAAGGPG